METLHVITSQWDVWASPWHSGEADPQDFVEVWCPHRYCLATKSFFRRKQILCSLGAACSDFHPGRRRRAETVKWVAQGSFISKKTPMALYLTPLSVLLSEPSTAQSQPLPCRTSLVLWGHKELSLLSFRKFLLKGLQPESCWENSDFSESLSKMY